MFHFVEAFWCNSKEKDTRMINLFFFCLLFVSVFSISCFSMQPMEDEYKQQIKLSKCQRKNKNRRDRQRALRRVLMDAVEQESNEEDEVYSKEKHALNEALIQAAKDGDAKQVAKLLIQGAKINYQDNLLKSTPLHWAAVYDHIKVAKLLLEKRARINIKNENGNTALHSLLDHPGKKYNYDGIEKTKKIIRLLVGKYKADVNALNFKNKTPYDCAVSWKIDVLETLEEFGVLPAKSLSI